MRFRLKFRNLVNSSFDMKFYTKKHKNWTFFDKTDIWRDMWFYDTILKYLLTCQFYQKIFNFNVFQYEISNRMSYKHTFYDNFEILTTNKISFYSLKMIGFIFSKNFKTIVESSLIAHSIGNFILKNIKIEHYLIKRTCDEMWRHMSHPRGKNRGFGFSS